ncbi:MAG: Eco57I restriction-modification methylase domain-containing protein, partial [Helicobacter sp.]|uniref:type IIG restriction enzyme/methyltransferase n=1 Tax=Helicobacter sp. TaxID=218 RepID=UPI0025C72271
MGGGVNRHYSQDSQEKSLESKAFYESILYYLRESLTHKNNNITHIILTNTRDFYCIDAQEYSQFAHNQRIIKAFENCENKEGNDSSTKRFYDELKDIISCLDTTLSYTHFALIEDILHDKDLLPLLYAILSPQVLLKRKSYIDANTLNTSFYNEFLYILGLEEVTQGAKILITPSKVRHTLFDALCCAFDYDKQSDFESAFSLLGTWSNRLLFLRLLESMLLEFKHIDKPFLDTQSISDFKTLHTLFFDVLAQSEEMRDLTLPKFFQSIPYLNSSLFDKTALEREGKEIKSLENKPLALYKDSILFKDKYLYNTLKLAHTDASLPLLEYLFSFLNAYNFTATAQESHQIYYDKLINAAVLGLVFEKLNGYKEGSFYTPSFITSYMCKQSLQKVVLTKFNATKSWQCTTLEELKHQLDKLTDSKVGYKEANDIFNSLRICDPSVGSGHFLVSALNELIFLKFSLGILCDENYERLKDITLHIKNDEIIVRDSASKLFTYTLPAHENIESHKIQKALFYNKAILIESCLFGVDINPNSCEITKLRLWIELLKHSFYKDISNKRLETLPNIDINIKCGNSLVSYFDLQEHDKNKSKPKRGTFAWLKNDRSFARNFKEKLLRYNHLVQSYKEKLGSKQELEREIKEIEIYFKNTLVNNGYLMESLKEHLNAFVCSYGDECFDMQTPFGMEMIKIIREERKKENPEHPFRFQPSFERLEPKPIDKRAQDLLANVHKDFLALESLRKGLRENESFEWRFAFPEVLSLESFEQKQSRISAHNTSKYTQSKEKLDIKDTFGDFVGFDLVIGNPPYMQVPKGIFNPNIYPYSEAKDKGKQNLYKVFIEQGFNLAKQNGIVSFITQSSIMCDLSAQYTRELLLRETQMHYFVEFKKNQKLFTNVSQGVCIIEFQKTKPSINQSFNIAINVESTMDNIDFEAISQEQILDFFPLYEIPLIKKGEMPI